MGAAQGVDCMVDLALRFKDRSDVGFLFVGRGSETSRLRARAAGLTSVEFVDEIDSEMIPGILAQCHVGLIFAGPSPHDA